MEKRTDYKILAVHITVALIVLIIPIIQLSIGFHFIVDDGEDPDCVCGAAPDLPFLMAMGGIFMLIFLGLVAGLHRLVSSRNKSNSDLAGKESRILVGRLTGTYLKMISV